MAQRRHIVRMRAVWGRTIESDVEWQGVIVIAAMFLLLVLRGFKAATAAPDNFGSYLAFGMTLLIGIEAFVNMAVVMGLVPTKGLALPFLSYGGSSLMATLMAVGIILNVSSRNPGELR